MLSWFLIAQDPWIYQDRSDLKDQTVNIPKVPDKFARREDFVIFYFIFEAVTRYIN